jgi:hypothetical protein
MDGEVLPKAGQVMQRVSDPGAACPKVKLAFSAPMSQNNGLFYFMRSAVWSAVWQATALLSRKSPLSDGRREQAGAQTLRPPRRRRAKNSKNLPRGAILNKRRVCAEGIDRIMRLVASIFGLMSLSLVALGLIFGQKIVSTGSTPRICAPVHRHRTSRPDRRGRQSVSTCLFDSWKVLEERGLIERRVAAGQLRACRYVER